MVDHIKHRDNDGNTNLSAPGYLLTEYHTDEANAHLMPNCAANGRLGSHSPAARWDKGQDQFFRDKTKKLDI